MYTIKLIVESKVDHVPILAKAVRAICNTVVEDEILLYNLELCIFEAVMNVIKHVYHLKAGNFIEIIVKISEIEIVFQVIDSGDKTFTPLSKAELNFDIESLPESGFGLYIIYNIMDEVFLSTHENKNILLMKKHVGTALKVETR